MFMKGIKTIEKDIEYVDLTESLSFYTNTHIYILFFRI